MLIYRLAYDFDRNGPFLWKGKPIWCGACNAIDDEIIETHTYTEAAAQGFHHSRYFSPHIVQMLEDGDAIFFFIQDGYLNTSWKGQQPSEGTNERIKAQLTKKDYWQEMQLR